MPAKFYKKTKKRIQNFLGRRPHRSFRLTRKRDYRRSLQLPGLWKFTMIVNKLLWSNRKLFLGLALVYMIVTILMVGIASQDTYSALSETLKSTGGDNFSSVLGKIGQSGLLFAAVATGSATSSFTDVQQIYAGIIALLAWLTSIWLLRNIMAGHKVKLRDGLYSAGSPILSTFIIFIILLVQLLPVALAVIGYGAAASSGLLNGGVEAMLFWVAAILLALISVYLITSTIFASVIITIPGMYPLRAIAMAGDLVVGRRMRILGRLAWMSFLVSITWLVVLIPLIMLDSWIKSIWSAIDWIPFIPLAFLTCGALTIVWVSSYIYVLYREVMKDEAKPAL